MNVHYKNIVIDGHNDTLLKIINESTWLPERDMKDEIENQLDLVKMGKGELNIAMFSAFTSGYYKNTAKSLSRSLALINALYWVEEINKDRFKIVHDNEEIFQVFKENKLGAIPTIEGAYGINTNSYLELVRQFKDLKIKVIGYNWDYSNDLGEGTKEVYSDGKTRSKMGLTDLGRKTLGEMKKLGIGIDVSHMNEETFWGVVDHVENPIIATHSGVYHIKQHPRNLNDNQIKAIKDNNGIIGVVFFPQFITHREKGYIDDIINHIDYIVKSIGIDYVGLGSDFDGATLPEDLKDVSEIYKITDKLIQRGYSNEDIKKIIGGNFLRVFKEIEHNQMEIENLSLTIETNYKMGSILEENENLKINLVGRGRGLTARFILDGRVMAHYEINGENLEFNLKFPNREKFHVFTVEVKDQRGRQIRDTKILYQK